MARLTRPAKNLHRVDEDAKSRVAVAIKLRSSGMQWAEIAARCNYKSADVARVLVHRVLAREQSQSVEQWRAEEIRRTDALLFAVWESASSEIDVDLQSVDRALAIMAARARYLGLYVQAAGEGGANQPVKRTYVGVEVDAV